MPSNKINLFQKQIAIPSDHGSWVFLLSPFIIGVFAGGEWNQALTNLLIGLFSIFFLRQPASIAVKALSKRRSRKVLAPALFWIGVYGLIGLFSLINIIRLNLIYILWLAVPGITVFAWHLWLVSQRSERHQMGIDIIASGVLALAAPAAYWAGSGEFDWVGWQLWVLTWLQSAASIVYAFLRLSQRGFSSPQATREKFLSGRRALLYTGFNLAFSGVLAFVFGPTPWIWLPYLIQFAETVWGTLNPAYSKKPTEIGVRQLIISSIFTLAFVLAWSFA